MMDEGGDLELYALPYCGRIAECPSPTERQRSGSTAWRRDFPRRYTAYIQIRHQRRRAIEALEARAPPPDSVATLVNSLQNGVISITLCVTLNANTGKIVLCIQIEWLFYNAIVSGVKL